MILLVDDISALPGSCYTSKRNCMIGILLLRKLHVSIRLHKKTTIASGIYSLSFGYMFVLFRIALFPIPRIYLTTAIMSTSCMGFCMRLIYQG